MMRRRRDSDGNNIYFDPQIGSGIFSTGFNILKGAAKVVGKKAVDVATSEGAKKLAMKAGEKAIEEGSKKIGQKVGEVAGDRIGDLMKKKTTPNTGGEEIAKMLKKPSNSISDRFEMEFLSN